MDMKLENKGVFLGGRACCVALWDLSSLTRVWIHTS